MPSGIFLGSSNPEFNKLVMLDHHIPDPKKINYDEDKRFAWHNFFVDIIRENKISEDITDDELKKYWIFEGSAVSPSKEFMVAYAHCHTCIKPPHIPTGGCYNCQYYIYKYLKRDKND